jgi:hypothetical protein
LAVGDLAGDLSFGAAWHLRRQPPARQVPEALLTVPPDDHHLALIPEHVEDHRDVPALVVPATGVPAVGDPVLQVARPERSTPPQLAQDVPFERLVRREPITHVRATFQLPERAARGEPPHRHAVDR